MAANTLFLLISNILARFDIRAAAKEDGGLESLEQATFTRLLFRYVCRSHWQRNTLVTTFNSQAFPTSSSAISHLAIHHQRSGLQRAVRISRRLTARSYNRLTSESQYLKLEAMSSLGVTEL